MMYPGIRPCSRYLQWDLQTTKDLPRPSSKLGYLPTSFLSKFLSILALAVALSALGACQGLTVTQVHVDPDSVGG